MEPIVSGANVDVAGRTDATVVWFGDVLDRLLAAGRRDGTIVLDDDAARHWRAEMLRGFRAWLSVFGATVH
jgi:hypothetical protein